MPLLQNKHLTVSFNSFNREYYKQFNVSKKNETEFTVCCLLLDLVGGLDGGLSRGTIRTGGGDYTAGMTATVTASANDGHIFESWTEGGTVVSTNPRLQFEVNRAYVLIANFKLAPTVTRVGEPPNGIAVQFQVAPGDPDTLYAITQEATIGDGYAGIWRSVNGGVNWTKILSGNAGFIRVGSGDNKLILAAIGGTYYLSTDGGDSWISDTIPDPIFGNPISLRDAAAVSSTDGIYFTSSDSFGPGLYKTTNLGSSWTRVISEATAGSTTNAQLDSVSVAPSDSDVIYTTTTFDSEFWKSSNGASSFISVLAGISNSGGLFNGGVSVNPGNADQVFIDGNISLNGGSNWNQVSNMSPNNTFWYEGSLIRFNDKQFEGFLEISKDSGQTWGYLMPLVDDAGNRFWGVPAVHVGKEAIYFEQATGSTVPDRIFKIKASVVRESLSNL